MLFKNIYDSPQVINFHSQQRDCSLGHNFQSTNYKVLTIKLITYHVYHL